MHRFGKLYIFLSLIFLLDSFSLKVSSNRADPLDRVTFFGDSTTAHLAVRGGIPKTRVWSGPAGTVLFESVNRVKCVHLHEESCDLTLAEAKKLDAGYREKFGETYMNQGVTVPTLEELLQLRQQKRPDLLLGVEIKEYTEECCDLTVELLNKYGVFEKCYFYAFDAKVIKYLRTKYNARTMGYPDFQMRNYEPDSYSYYAELGLGLGFVKSEIFPIYAAKKLPMHMYCADNEEGFCPRENEKLSIA